MKVQRCSRCSRRFRNQGDWIFTMQDDGFVSLSCPACETTHEDVEAEVNEPTDDRWAVSS